MVLERVAIGPPIGPWLCDLAIHPKRLCNRSTLHLLHGRMDCDHPVILVNSRLQPQSRFFGQKIYTAWKSHLRVGLGDNNSELPSDSQFGSDPVLGILANALLKGP